MTDDKQRQSSSEWTVQEHIQLMFRRFDFSSYDEVRSFLDELGDLSEEEGYYPDLTFSRTYVNVTIKARGKELAQADFNFSAKVDAAASAIAGQPISRSS